MGLIVLDCEGTSGICLGLEIELVHQFLRIAIQVNSGPLSIFCFSSTYNTGVGGYGLGCVVEGSDNSCFMHGMRGSGKSSRLAWYLFVWVDFLYTVVSMVLSGFRRISTSRNASWAWASLSNVNWMVSSMVFRWQWKSCTISDLRAHHVSSTYLFLNFGGLG